MGLVVGKQYGMPTSKHRLISREETTVGDTEGVMYMFEALARPTGKATPTQTGEAARNIVTRHTPAPRHDTLIEEVLNLRASESVSGYRVYHIKVFAAGNGNHEVKQS
jgi:hypothetical protein